MERSFAWTPGDGYKSYPPFVNLTGNRLAVRGPESLSGGYPNCGAYVAVELPEDQLYALAEAINPVVGSASLTTGKRVPVRKRFADAIWEQAEAEDERRKAALPDEASAISQLYDAQHRLKDMGWQDPIYAPKDGSPLDIIELGSTGIHRGYYDGEWPTGSWWITDGDLYPCRPALARPASVDTHPQGGDAQQAPAPLSSAVGDSRDAQGQPS